MPVINAVLYVLRAYESYRTWCFRYPLLAWIIRWICIVLVIIACVYLVFSIFVVLLHALGWRSAGVAAGSFAAGLQSTIWRAFTGGIFSVLQRCGTTLTVSPVWTLLSVVVLGICFFVTWEFG
ncbi:hypothetical protein CONPUDRAFT_132849 [Coniophora puteana RWD-64-598 SS2]|uniref:Uncharacterized protein n=1 Tax=Coniophora puteana (strain RWD-64-598) TaxID=741705 RepID=R7SEM5_CONPW|nr:uncharacterized protein CONPUDRAFT_132849 [Coniophora puteana RWD-64-598 SS2]EIW74631.1 hypothetical protein CONPUDRAFT_132849 [Coniophora puteana RWD-64-598 SS2]